MCEALDLGTLEDILMPFRERHRATMVQHAETRVEVVGLVPLILTQALQCRRCRHKRFVIWQTNSFRALGGRS